MSCDHNHSSLFSEKNRLLTSILIATLFTLVELTGGFLSNSLALLSDALHLFSDVGALVLGLLVLRYAEKPASHTKTYGYARAEALGALLSGLFLWGLMGYLIYESVLRFFSPESVQGSIVVITSLIALIANGLMLKLLHGDSFSLTTKAAYLHVVSDLLGSIGVLANGLIIRTTGWYRIDPILSFFIAFVIIRSTYHTIASAIHILMEGAPKNLCTKKILSTLNDLPSVEGVHDLHVWCISSKKSCLSAHLVTEEDPFHLIERATALLKQQFSIDHITLQIEHPQASSCKPLRKE
ncbi:MAG: cation diffusion facilitator family transporter [Chlamydiota bacterium]